MENILIIKTNASGDVLRTTVLLHLLKGNIFWITASYNIPLFPDRYPNLTLIPFEHIPSEILNIHFDLILNLEEDLLLAKKVSAVQTKKLIGVYWSNGTLDYSPDSAGWFDMSLISKLPSPQADALKRKNPFSYQKIICSMLGHTFQNEKYISYKSNSVLSNAPIKIGMEARVGKTWPNKKWHGFEELEKKLISAHFQVTVFETRDALRKYMDDIQHCSLIICGDTLAMHIALAYDIRCIGIFNCTSTAEIFDYNTLTKIVSPLLHEAFYKRNESAEIIHSISVAQVYREVNKLLRSSDEY